MSKTKCPGGCDKLFITKAHAASHADIAHPDWINKRKGWITPYGFFDFTEPVTYEEAKEMAERFFHKPTKE